MKSVFTLRNVAHAPLVIIRHRLFTAVSALSLALCLATVALWVLSYRWEEQIYLRFYTGSAYFTSSAGRLGFDFIRSARGRREFGLFHDRVTENDFTYSFEPAPLGFAWRYPYEGALECAIPHWPPLPFSPSHQSAGCSVHAIVARSVFATASASSAATTSAPRPSAVRNAEL